MLRAEFRLGSLFLLRRMIPVVAHHVTCRGCKIRHDWGGSGPS